MPDDTSPAFAHFSLAPALAEESIATVDLPLSRLILRDESQWPWVVLVPRRSGSEELFDLLPADAAQLLEEITQVSAALKGATGATKINVAQFGNVCRQLHLHIVARSEGDPLWPGGVVGVGKRTGYSSDGVPDWWDAFLARIALTNP